MGQITWYKRDPQDAINGMMGLSLEERGAYNTVLDLFYLRDGKLPDDERFIAGFLGVDVRVWKRIRARLIELGKIFIDAGHIHNRRADEEVRTALAKVVSARNAGKQSARVRSRKSDKKSNDYNDRGETDVGTGVATDVEADVGESKSKNTLPDGNGAEAPNLTEKLWSDGLAVVAASDVPDAKARALLGKWRKAAVDRLGKDEGEARVLAMLAQAQRDHVLSLVPWMEAAIRGLAGPPRHESREDRERRERAEYIERNYGPDSPRARMRLAAGGDVG
jgi:uncharacterized protein YdaU (DUF1376 family)